MRWVNNANKDAAKIIKASVKQYDWRHSERPKYVYLSSVVHSVLSAVSRWYRPLLSGHDWLQ